MLDIFGRQASEVLPAFSADSSSLTFKGVDIANIATLLVQSLSASYTQAVTRIFELSSAGITFIQGRSQGQMNLNRIIGPAKTGTDFITKFSSVCNLKDNSIIFNLKAKQQEAGCSEGSDEGFIASGCIITSLSYSVTSQDLVIQQNINMEVVSLGKTKNGAAA